MQAEPPGSLASLVRENSEEEEKLRGNLSSHHGPDLILGPKLASRLQGFYGAAFIMI